MELINSIKRYKLILIILILISLITTVIYLGQSQEKYRSNGTQPFVVDLSITKEDEVIFRLISLDGKEKVEVVDGKFADGTKILESRGYINKFYGWKQTGAGQSGYKQQDKIRVCGYNQYLIYEAIDANIARMEYKDNFKNEIVPFIEIQGRRFVAIYNLRNNSSYQINFLNNKGEAILVNIYD